MTSKFALVIANTEYQDASLAKLTAPGKDAEEFARVLREPGLAAFDDVQVLLNEGEGRIRRSIARFFVDRKPDELLLLYFSGHGVRNEQGQLYLAVSDTERNILEATGIPAEFVTHAMNNSRSQRQLLVLDCCNSGAFAYGGKAASALGNSMGIAAAFEGSGYGRVVLTATDATQYAWEGDKVIGQTQKSVFTHFLIEGLKGDADRDGDGCITVDELYDYAYEQVVQRTPKQTPGKWSYKQQGDIILRDNLKPRDVKPAPLPSELLYYLEHSSSGVRSTGVQELIRLLDGKHLGLARAAEDKLREIAASDDSLTLRKTASNTLTAHGLAMEEPALAEAPKTIEPPVGRDVTSSREIPSPRVPPVPQEEGKGEGVILRKVPEQKKVASRLNLRIIGIILGALLVIGIFGLAGQGMKDLLFATPTTISTMTGEDGMTLVYVPAGKFMMGSKAKEALSECQKFRSDCQLDWFTDEEPKHEVNLDGFWIDQTEVTNALYSKCVQDGVCYLPPGSGSYTRDSYYGNPKFDSYPVIYISWNAAEAYCKWAGRRLPTEAEWEKAARGDDERVYPWGDGKPDRNLLNYGGNVGDTTAVRSYPNGISPYGALDMAGNVMEWVADSYDANYYENSPLSNPFASKLTGVRVVRGGSWFSNVDSIRSADRYRLNPYSAYYYMGFRCARSE